MGYSVGISSDGNRVISGSPTRIQGLDPNGVVRAYDFISVNSTWSQLGSNIDGESIADWHGISSELSGDGITLIIGAHNPVVGVPSGQAEVYSILSGSWVQVGMDIESISPVDETGRAVDINFSGDIIAVGAPGSPANGVSSGAVRVLQLQSGIWSEIGSVLLGGAGGDRFGQSLELSKDGHTIVIGSPEFSGSFPSMGRAQIFTCNSSELLTEFACNTYISPSGKAFDSTGIYFDTIPNSTGCDSLITINLTINNSIVISDVVEACDSFTWIDGNVYTTDTLVSDTFISSSGCDSIRVLDLTISNSIVISDVVEACDSFTWIDGNVYTADTLVSDTFISSSGCDSIRVLDLTISNSTVMNVFDTICAGDTLGWHGEFYYQPGQYTDSLSSINGCDSVYILNLYVNQIDTSIAIIGGGVIESNNANATYQWLECLPSGGYNNVDGATNQDFLAPATGDYAVALQELGCADTSNCRTVLINSLFEVGSKGGVVYPNPVSTHLYFEGWGNVRVRIYDINGVDVMDFFTSVRSSIDVSNWNTGTYIIQIMNDREVFYRKILITSNR
jgi:hypothetical protein